MPRRKKLQTPPTRYYVCEGEPSRIHSDEDGDLTGDIYREGRGLVSADPTYIYYHSFEISRAHYEHRVREAGGDSGESRRKVSR